MGIFYRSIQKLTLGCVFFIFLGTSSSLNAQPTAPEIYINPSFAEAWVYPNNQYFWSSTISNLGNSDLNYSFPGFSTGSPPPGFVFSVQPATGIIPPGGSENILIGWDPNGYMPGVYYQDLICESNDPVNPTMIISNKMNLGQMAYLTGTVIDLVTQQPLDGVEVSYTSVITHTLSDGSYLLPIYPYNGYVIFFEKLGYYWNSLDILALNPGDTLIQDISLEPIAYPVPWVIADPVDCNDPVPSQINWTLPTGPTEVSYDDGSYEDLYAWALPGGECAVKFSPNSYPCQIIGGRVQVGDGSWPTASWIGSSFTVVIYDEDVNGMPGTVIDSFPVVVNNYGWIEFWSNTVELNSGNFFLSMKQLNPSPYCAPVGIDLDAPLENRSYMKAPGGSWQFSMYQDFMIRAFVDQVSLPSNVVDYTLARISDFDPNMSPQFGTMTILADTTATNYQDNDFANLAEDWYAYAVKVNYNSGFSSQWVYSNIIGMHKGKIVEFHLNDCLGVPISGAEINLVGENYPYVWFQDVTDSSGSCIFECTWAGAYTYEIEKFGFDPIKNMQIHIESDTVIGYEWNEITWAPRNLIVDDISGSIDWDDPVVMALSEDFEGYMLQYPWQMTSNGQGWFLTSNGSSLNFPVLPWNSQYICVNDDALGSGNDGSVDYLITPPLDLRGTDEFRMTFDSFFTGVNGQLATVEYSEDAGASWEVFYNISPDMYWSSIDLDLSSISGVNAPGVNWFAFHADDGGGQASGWAIDNVEILAEIIVTDNYQVFLDNTLIATTDTNFYQFEGLTFGQEYTACVAAVYPCGISDLVCVDFTSNHLRAPEWIQGDSVGNEAELIWFMDTSYLPGALIGYNIYRDSVLINFLAYNGGDTSWYTDTPPDPMCYDFYVSALYDGLTPGDTVESHFIGPEEVCLVFGAMLPMFQDWTSGTFEPGWTPGDNWVVNGQIGNAEPAAEFKWDPILNDYEECILSGPINGVYPETKSDPYTDGQFMLSFDVQLDNVNPTGNEYFKAEVWSNGEWYTVSEFNNANGSFEWETVEVDITEHAMGYVFKLRFMAVGAESSDILSWFVDNIEVFHYCAPPQNVDAESNGYEIEVNWDIPMSSKKYRTYLNDYNVDIARTAGDGLMGYNIFLNIEGAGYEFLDYSEDTFYLYEPPSFGMYCFYVTSVYEGCESLMSNEACEIIPYWGLGENVLNGLIQIYPNPTDDRINIESGSPFTRIQLLDLSGHTLMIQEAVHQQQATMDVSSLAPGVYLLRIDTEEGRVVRKVIIE